MFAESHDVGPAGRRGFGSSSEVVIGVGLLAILLVIFVPLSPAMMDVLLIFNITVSLLILMTTACLQTPLEFSVFPSLLLVVTFFRLALNIATTRLILGEAKNGDYAAGGVIKVFADVIAGQNIVVGFIVFSIIMVVQFVVITKGTTRISEVAARFTLDAMPGKQLSIDSDLNSGLIDEHTARRLREETNEEADFYGTMDGASKFVRGEAIAGLVITCVNIGAGFCIGVIYHKMPVVEAADVFTRLTIGDGLVSQVPALMVSVATALLVTKNSAGENLGQDVGRQLFTNERVLFLVAFFLILLLASGLPAGVLLGGASCCIGTGIYVRRRRVETEDEFEEEYEVGEFEPANEEPTPESVRSLLPLEPLELELGFRLVCFVDEERGGDLLDHIARVRERVALDLGFVVPPIKVHDNIRLRPTEYAIKLRGNALGTWRVYTDRLFALVGDNSEIQLSGEPGRDPITDAAGLWIDESQCPLAASAGYSVRSTPELIVEHLHEVVRSHAAEILTREEVSRLVTDLQTRAPSLLNEVIPARMKLGEVHRVLQSLLEEQVSIRDLETVLEVLADYEGKLRTPTELAEKVRRALARSICGSVCAPNRTVKALLLEPPLEEYLQRAHEETAENEELGLEEELAQTLARRVVEELTTHRDKDVPVVVVCAGTLRPHLRRLVSREDPRVIVLAYEEVSEEFEMEVCGSVAFENVA